MESPPRPIPSPSRQRITPVELSAQIASLHQQVQELEVALGLFMAGVELRISMQPSVLAAHRNIKASINHLAAAGTLAMAQQQEAGQ